MRNNKCNVYFKSDGREVQRERKRLAYGVHRSREGVCMFEGEDC